MTHPPLSNGSGEAQTRGSRRLSLVLVGVGLLTATVLVVSGLSLLRSPTDPQIAAFRVLAVESGDNNRVDSAFRVEFQLREAGYPLLLHLDAEGMPSLLFPEREWVPVGRGYRVALPDSKGSVAWWLDDDSGEGSFLLALAQRDDDAPEDLLVEMERVAARARTPQDARRRVREYLSVNVGEVQEIRGDRIRG